MTIRRRRHKRRGILLLLVLSLLVLFVLIGTTFIIVAGHYKTASDAHSKHEITGDAPQDQLDSALLELIRGSTNPTSPLRHNSLLEDTYGTDGFFGTVVPRAFEKFGGNPTPADHVTGFIGNNGLLQIVFRCPIRNPIVPRARHELNQSQLEIVSSDYYAGSVITMLSGPAAGRSARILRYSPPNVVDTLNNTDGTASPDTIDDDLVLNDGVIVIKLFDDIDSVSGLSLNTPAGRSRFILELSRQSSFVVNGRVHNGTGAGYVADSPVTADIGTLNATDQFGTASPYNVEIGLLPFYQGNIRHSVGGLDESWDAADYQNVFLAMEPNPLMVFGNQDWHNEPYEALPIPSFHRPFLVNYWSNRLLQELPAPIEFCMAERDFQMPTGAIYNSQWSRFRRSIIARPLAIEHPFFNGSNVAFSHPGFPNGIAAQVVSGSGVYQIAPHPQFNRDGDNIPDFIDPDTDGDGILDDFNMDGLADMAAVSGPWDVDNDNDGTPESVWVDLGYPVQSTKDGRLFKPLFAIHCVDLDGKMNVNAHGTTSHLEPPVPISYRGAPYFPPTGGIPNASVPSVTTNMIPTQLGTARGQGYGPPEVSLLRSFQSMIANMPASERVFPTGTTAAAAVAAFNPLLAGRLRGVTNGINAEPTNIQPVPGLLSAVPETINVLSETGIPDDYGVDGANFALPPDLHGRGMIVVDRLGQPYHFNMGLVNERLNDPYESNLVEPNAYDALYSVAELESVYRYFDPGSENISSRLRPFFGALSPLRGQDIGRLYTTHSSAIETSNATLPLEDRKEARTITERMKQILIQQLTNPAKANEAWLNQQILTMLPPELRSGLKMDVNRRFGNGLDDTTNGIVGIVDDPLENGVDANSDGQIDYPTDREQIFGFGSQSVAGKFFHDVGTVNDGTGNASNVPTPLYAPARQIFARHLYCLSMFIMKEFEWPTNDPNPDEIKARRLAQWAINVVDFRDNDSIMTPFEYDVNPFDGWDVNGNIADNDGPLRGLVWGVEQPEVLITETVALHNRGVRDLATEDPEPAGDPKARVGAGPMEDKDLDQYRKPEGSLFIELHSPRSPKRQRDNRHAFANELYFKTPTIDYLDLGRAAPGVRRVPIWRVAIAKHNEPGDLSYEQRSIDTAGRDREEFEPDNAEIDRIVWFASAADGVDPSTLSNPERIYYNLNTAAGTARLQPGAIAVIAPRLETVISTHTGSDEPGQNLEIRGQVFRHFMNGDDTNTLVEFDMAASNRTGEYFGGAGPVLVQCGRPSPYDSTPAKLTDPDWYVGLNVSEPDPVPLSTGISDYYPDPNPANDKSDPDRLMVYQTARDIPLDQDQGTDREVLPVGTSENYATAFLQRLANPALPWNPSDPAHPDYSASLIVNPYKTVDWAPIDLHVYNGDGDNLDEGESPPPMADSLAFLSRERSGDSLTPAPTVNNQHFMKNIWTNRIVDSNDDGAVDERAFGRSRGDVYRTFATSGTDRFQTPLIHSFGYLNPAFGWNTNTAGSGYVSQVVVPLVPFPDMTWNNRPFVSAFELLQVPMSSAGRLPFEQNLDISLSAEDPYDADGGSTRSFHAPFTHLLNFFHGSTDDTNPDIGVNLTTLMDLVEVPSRFVGTRERLNQQLSGYEMNGQGLPLGQPDNTTSWRAAEFTAPFNELPIFRDPGKINLNTINNPHILAALGSGAFYRDFRRSLREPNPGTMVQLPNIPSRFANPFRAASSADLMPLAALQPDAPADATILRADPAAPTLHLFHDSLSTLQGNTDWNPRFRYQHLQRIQNSVTTKSNLFAVWITVGYFEALPWNPSNPLNTSVTPVPDFAHPDGYQLGQEIGIDTGEVERHRAFYIIDRSIPVAFEPGENHNVEDAILLKRFIE